MKNIFRKEILALSAYHVADASGLIKLDAMENPYTWPEDLQQHWLETLKNCELNRYPDPEAKDLAQIIKQQNQIPDEFDIILGNGSDEIIQMLLMAVPTESKVLAPTPTFVMYQQISQSLGLNFVGIPLLAKSFELDLPGMLKTIDQQQPKLIFLAYPNNPTGNLYDNDAIREILQSSQGMVILDEAYSPFADASFMGELPHYDNLLVMRTVSKLGLAGIRLGYLVGKPEIIRELNKIRLPYNINCLTQATAQFALSHHGVFDQQTRVICEQRTWMLAKLNQLDGITAYPSATNFIMFKAAANRATEIFEAIKQQGVLIKNLHLQGGLLQDCLRVTVGKPEENQAFINALTGC